MTYVKEAITYYKSIRSDIRKALPYWPLGLSHYTNPWVSLGLMVEGRDHLAVWRRNSQTPFMTIPVNHLKGKEIKVLCAFPEKENCSYTWNKETGELTVELPNPVSARLFRLEY
jgi:alpha-galactosidase